MTKILKFHQFIRLERGPVNTCIYDLLKGDIFQVPNGEIDTFQNRQYSEIPDFIRSLEEAELVIRIEENGWIPIDVGVDEKLDVPPLLLELEEGAEIEQVRDFLANSKIKIKKIHYFGRLDIGVLFPGIPIVNLEKNFSFCEEISTVTGVFFDIREKVYRFNKNYNNCWGTKIAIAKDGSIRPCIYSNLVIGHIYAGNNFIEICNEADRYRRITKNSVEKCKDCEFKYACFDCREIAMQKGGNLFSTNPTCKYDPYTGK